MKSLLFVLIASLLAPVAPPQEEDGTRAAFIKKRPTARTTKPPTARPKPKPKPKVDPVATNGTAPPVTPVVPVAHTEPVGLGLTLFQVFDKTRGRRADPTGVFREGDMVRFVLESSIDGYLYIFVLTHLKDGTKKPVMIYPDARLNDGDNFVWAHSMTEVPSRRHPKFDVFRMVGSPAVEQVFFVVSRDPLEGVPIGEELVRHCEGKAQPCLWSPGGSVWAPLERQSSAEVRLSVRKDAGKELSRVEEEAIGTRDLLLGSSDDEPTVVALNTSADTPLLVREVKIRHEK